MFRLKPHNYPKGQYFILFHQENDYDDDDDDDDDDDEHEPQNLWDTLPVVGHRMLVRHPRRPKQPLASVSIPHFPAKIILLAG